MCTCGRCQDATWPPEPDCCPRCDGVIARREAEKVAEGMQPIMLERELWPQVRIEVEDDLRDRFKMTTRYDETLNTVMYVLDDHLGKPESPDD